MSNLSQKAKSILIVESDDRTINTLINFLKQEFACETAKSTKSAIKLIQQRNFSVILINSKHQDVDNLSFLSIIQNFSPDTSVIYLSDTESFKDSVKAFRSGSL